MIVESRVCIILKITVVIIIVIDLALLGSICGCSVPVQQWKYLGC